MPRFRTVLRYDWPLHLVLWLANGLPDNVAFLKLRGRLACHFLGSCGRELNIGRNVTFYNPSQIHLGDYVHFAYGCLLMANSQIRIEDEVMLGPYCVLVSGNHSRKEGSYRFGADEILPIRIGKGSWLGAHAVITAGCEVGCGSLVAAGAVVTESFPNNVMVGGVPARIIKKLEE